MIQKTDNFSKTIKVGRVAHKSYLYTDMSDGRQYVKFTLAINKDKDKPDYYNCISYNATGRYVDRCIQVGDKVLICGSDCITVNKSANGMHHKSIQVIADTVISYDTDAAQQVLDTMKNIFSYAEVRSFI